MSISKMARAAIAVLLVFGLLTGCTHMEIDEGKQTRSLISGRITSTPSDATIYFYEEFSEREGRLGETPLFLRMKPGGAFVHIRAEKIGYRPQTIILPKINQLPYHFQLQKKDE